MFAQGKASVVDPRQYERLRRMPTWRWRRPGRLARPQTTTALIWRNDKRRRKASTSRSFRRGGALGAAAHRPPLAGPDEGGRADRSGTTASFARTADMNAPREMTDGLHLVADALKLNGIDTIYGVVGIPVTDLARV